ncbi:GL14635 [Drosophila persimilis]|uniref:GL14635 n=1 Tax=Drosophila persimilis TaxID=7234 RepID=B4GVN7_DROPE|nr:GL14635 [Drosophila persimilis]
MSADIHEVQKEDHQHQEMQWYTRLNDLHEFQKLCVDSVQKFQDLVASNVFTCQTNFDVLDPSSTAHDLPGEDEDHINFDPPVKPQNGAD